MSSEPADKIIEHEIRAALASTQQPIRPNKLRKIICKKISETNWTQFQRVYDSMKVKLAIRTSEVDGDLVVHPLSGELAVASHPDAKKPPTATATPHATATANNKNLEPNQQIETVQMEVPFAIIKYISRKGSKKRKNIELNTKTQITFDVDTARALRSGSSSAVESSTMTITKTWNHDDEVDENESQKKAKSLLKTAKYHISKMVKAYKENPDHFTAKKAGGTFAEQAEAKKKKVEALKSAKKRYKKRDQEDDTVPRKKKERKFY
jgi:hypothetical protein